MAVAALGDFSTVYGAVGDAISLFGGIQDTLFPEADPDSLNIFKVFVGLVRGNDSESRSTTGDAPSLAAWNAVGGFMNQDTPILEKGNQKPKIADGGNRIYKIESRQEPDYLSVVQRGNDGICIHLIIGTSAGVGRQFLWTGDMGRVCGAPWYAQRSPITDGHPAYVPACVWIDGNGDSGHIWKGFNMHLGSFGGSLNDDEDVAAYRNMTAKAWTENRDLLCASEPRFSMYEDIKIGNQIRTYNTVPDTATDPGSEEYATLALGQDNWGWGEKPATGLLPTGPDGRRPSLACVEDECPPEGPSWNRNLKPQEETRRKMRRQEKEEDAIARVKKRQVIHADRLIVSNIPQHSAVELCDSPYSLGPDMVAMAEGMFCDMSEKQLWPVCADSTASYCFDMDSQTVRGSDNTLPSSETPLYSNSTIKPAGAVSLAAGDPGAVNPTVPSKLYTTVDTWGP
jgi:hypothetical protein